MHRLIGLVILFLTIGIYGCGGLKGNVCLDANHDNTCSADEKLIANAAYKVTVDGVTKIEGVTGIDGSFSHSLSESGQWCVSINENDLSTVGNKKRPILVQYLPDGDAPNQPKAMIYKASSLNLTDSDDKDKDKEDNTDDNSEPTTKPKPSKPADFTRSGRACKNVSGISAHIDVPIALDVQTSIDQISETMSEINARPGELFQLAILHPESCELYPLILPAELEPAGNVGEFDALTGRFNLSTIQKQPYPSITTSVVEDPMVKIEVSLRVKPEFSGSDRSVVIRPKANCISGAIPLAPQTIAIDNKANLSLSLDWSGEKVSGAVNYVEAIIINKGNQVFTDAKLIVEFPEYSTAVESLSGSGCSSLGDLMTCQLEIQPKKTIVRKFKYRLEDGLTQSKKYKITGRLTGESPVHYEIIPVSDVIISVEPE